LLWINSRKKKKNKIPAADQNFDEGLITQQENSIFLSPTNSIEITKLISNLKDKKATGPSSINTRILKMIAPTISECLQKFLMIVYKMASALIV